MPKKVKTDFKHTKALIKNFGHLKKTMFLAGTDYQQYIEKQWDHGKNGNQKRFKPLTPSYKKFKESKNKKGIADNRLSSDLIGTLSTNMNSDLQAKVFLGDQQRGRYVSERNKDVGIWDITTKKARKILSGIHRRLSPK